MERTCSYCGTTLNGLRLVWESQAGDPLLYLHEGCVRQVAFGLLAGLESDLVCRWCGKPIVDAQRTTRAYCDDRCKSHAQYRRNRNKLNVVA